MADLVLTPITTGYNVSNINSNFDDIEEIVNTDLIHKSGGHNVLEQDLDMNSNQILNIQTDEGIVHCAANVEFVLSKLANQINISNLEDVVDELKINVRNYSSTELEGNYVLTEEESMCPLHVIRNGAIGTTRSITFNENGKLPVTHTFINLYSNSPIDLVFPVSEQTFTIPPSYGNFTIQFTSVGLFLYRSPFLVTPIESGTATKVTYNEDGIIIFAQQATTADIVDTTDKRYVTDAQLAAIGVGGGALDTSVVSPSTNRQYVTDAEKLLVGSLTNPLTTASVAPSINRNYVTDAEKAALGQPLAETNVTTVIPFGDTTDGTATTTGKAEISGKFVRFNIKIDLITTGTGGTAVKYKGFPFVVAAGYTYSGVFTGDLLTSGFWKMSNEGGITVCRLYDFAGNAVTHSLATYAPIYLTGQAYLA